MIKDMDIKKGYQKIIRRDEITIISKGCKLVGNIEGECDFKVAGVVEGDIVTAGEVVVEEGALVQGSISAGSVEVKGEVRGDIRSDESVRLEAKSIVEGNIEYGVISIEKGAYFNGTSTALKKEPESEEQGVEKGND